MTQIEQKFEQSIGRALNKALAEIPEAFGFFTEYLNAKLKFLKKIHERE